MKHKLGKNKNKIEDKNQKNVDNMKILFLKPQLTL